MSITSKTDGLPVVLGSYVCPFCETELHYVKRTSVGVVYGHYWHDGWENIFFPEICPNSAALFLLRNPGGRIERLEPIV